MSRPGPPPEPITEVLKDLLEELQRRKVATRPPRDWIQISITALPGLAAVIALIFTWVSVNSSNSQLRTAEQGQITDRYNAAITNLGSSSVDVRLGGIYALQRIMQDSSRDQSTVVAVLCAFVRDQAKPATAGSTRPAASPPASSASSHPSTDIQAALTVVGTRNTAHDGFTTIVDFKTIDFTGADLAGASLAFLNLSGARFSSVDLSDANLDGANLRGVGFSHANLTDAMLSAADLTDDDFSDARLPGAAFLGSVLSRVSFIGADLTHAYFAGGDLAGVELFHANLAGAYLTGANLAHANLGGANLAHANLGGANLAHADLTGADLTGANLTRVKGFRTYTPRPPASSTSASSATKNS